MYDDDTIVIEKEDQCFNCRFNGDSKNEKLCPALEFLTGEMTHIATDLEDDHFLVTNCDFYEKKKEILKIVK
jgi:hypothetical protein